MFISLVFLKYDWKTRHKSEDMRTFTYHCRVILFIRWLQDNGIRKLTKHVFKYLTNLEEL